MSATEIPRNQGESIPDWNKRRREEIRNGKTPIKMHRNENDVNARAFKVRPHRVGHYE